MPHDLTAINFFGEITWTGGSDKERMERLHAYESTGLEPDDIRRVQRDNEAYRLAGLRYEEQIDRLKSAVRRAKEEEYE